MFKLELFHFLAIALVLGESCFLFGEGGQEEILVEFFKLHEISFDKTYVDKYSSPIERMMRDVLIEPNKDQKNKLVVEFIYGFAKDKFKDDTKEIMLTWFDLMVPASQDQMVYRLAKEDLRKFCSEERVLAEELLNSTRNEIESSLEENSLTLFSFEDAASMLKRFYYHWIPLGRLMRKMGV